MSLDLTEIFIEATKSSDNWRAKNLKKFIESVENNKALVLNWDTTVPENWIEINMTRTPVAIVRRTFPFAFVLESHFEVLSIVLNENNILYILVDDFNQNGLTLDNDKVDTIFPEKFSDIIDTENFTLQELFYGTM